MKLWVFTLALAVRLALFRIGALTALLERRIEFSNPDSSFLGMRECLFLHERQFPLYDGGQCHHQVLLVNALHAFVKLFQKNPLLKDDLDSLGILYALLDVCIGWILFKLCSKVQTKFPKLFAPDWNFNLPPVSLIRSDNSNDIYYQYAKKMHTSFPVDLIVTIYLFNPITLLSCLSRSTALFSNFCIASSVLMAFKGRVLLTAFFLAMATHLSVYPFMLVPAFVILVYRVSLAEKYTVSSSTGKSLRFLIAYSILVLTLLGGALIAVSSESLPVSLHELYTADNVVDKLYHSFVSSHWISRNVQNFMNYFKSTYGVILMISDLSVNVGPYWYFFTEIFDQFRLFFVAVVQLHLIGFSIPLTIKFREDPLFSIFIIYGSIALLKSYPSLPDFAFWMAFLLVTQMKLFKYFNNPLISFSLVLFSLILLPSFHFIWIYLGSGNSNFCYAITLVFAVGISSIIGDSVQGWLRRAFDYALVSKSAAIGNPKALEYQKWLGINVGLK